MSDDTTTSEHSRQTETGALMSSAADSPARTSVKQDERPESQKVHGAVCGASTPGSFAIFDPDTLSWRTSQRCLLGGWIEFSETWPRSGSMRNGRCFLRAPS